MKKLLLATTVMFGLWNTPVNAAFIAPLIATALGGLGSVGTAILGTALSIGANWLMQKLFAQDPKQTGVKQRMETGGDKPVSFIMGKYATAGKLDYVNSFDGTNSKLVMVVSLSELPVSALSSKLVVNGKVCDINFASVDADGFMTVDQYDKNDTHYLYVKFYDGSQTVADPWLVSTFGADAIKPWTSNMIGKGCAYAIIIMRYSKKGVWSGVPTFKFVLNGIPLYNPKKDTSVGGSGVQRWNDPTTWGFSSNLSVMNYNAIRGVEYNGKWIWGGQKVSAAALPNEIWFPAITTCDEQVELADGTFVDRYAGGAEVSVDMPPLDFIREVDNSTSGYTTEYGGVWKTFVGGPSASVFSFVDEDVIVQEEQTDDLFQPIQQTYNVVTATYPEPKSCWEMKDAPIRYFDDLIEEDDGQEFNIDLQFPFVSERNQVQRLMRAAVLDSRRQRVHTMIMPPETAILEVYDVVNWNSTRNGYINKKFIIISKDDMANCNQLWVIREIDPDDYNWDKTYELDSSVGPLDDAPLSPYNRDFTVTASSTNSSTGRDKPAIGVTWTFGAFDIDCDYIRWEVRLLGGTDVIDRNLFSNVEDNTHKIVSRVLRFNRAYQVRFKAVPVSRSRDATWTNWKTVTMLSATVPSAPSLQARSFLADDGTLDFYVLATWTAVVEEVEYVLSVSDGTDTWYVHANKNSKKIPVTSGKTYTIMVRSKQDDGELSDWSSSTALAITKKTVAPTAPTSLTLIADFQKLTLDWNKSPDKDYAFSRVYRATTNDFTTATDVRDIRATGWTNSGLGNLVTRYYWVTFFDRSGNESAKFPASNTGGISGTTTAVTDSDTDGTGPATPTGLGVTQRTALNGDGKVEITFVVTWTGIANKKATYVVRVDDGTDFDYYAVKDIGTGTATVTRKRFKAISGVAYSISVAAVSGTGVIGSYTSNVSLTASKKATAPTAPTTLSVKAGTHRNILTVNASPDADFRRVIVYSSPTNNFLDVSKTEAGRQNSTRFIDDDLGNNVTRYYWVTFEDNSGNESSKFPSSNTGGISGTTLRVVEDDADQTAPGKPATPALSSITGDIDADGTLDAGLQFTITQPAGVAVKSYEIDLQRANAQGSSGSMTGYTSRYHITKTAADPNTAGTTTLVQIETITSKWFKISARAISTFGIPGPWSDFQLLGFKPAAYNAMSAITASAPAVTPVANGFKITFVPPTDPTYFETAILVGGVELTRVSASAYQDNTIRTAGTSYTFTVIHYDRAGNPSTVSSGTAATYRSASASVSVGDFDTTALAVPSCTNSTPATVTNACYMIQENQDVNGDGSVDTVLSVKWLSVTDAASYEVEVYVSTPSVPAFTLTGKGSIVSTLVYSFEANTNAKYKARVRARNAYGQPGGWTTNVVVLAVTTSFSSFTGLQPAKRTSYSTGIVCDYNCRQYNVNMYHTVWSRDDAFDHTEVYFNVSGTAPSASTRAIGQILGNSGSGGAGSVPYSAFSTIPSTLYGWFRNVDKYGNATAWAAMPSSPVSAQGITDVSIENDAIYTRHLNDSIILPEHITPNAVNVVEETTTSGSISLSSGTPTIVQTHICSHSVDATSIMIIVHLKNTSGGTRTVDIELLNGGTSIKTWLSEPFVDNQSATYTVRYSGMTGSSSTFNLRVTAASASAFSRRTIETMVQKR